MNTEIFGAVPADYLARLARRAEIVRGIRTFFDDRGFLEVTTPVMIDAPAPEPHIDCPPCEKGFLRASPELQMKKLLAAGCTRLYQMGPCFRAGERGSRHNPEFTMLEWYRTQATYLDILQDTKDLLSALLPSANLPITTVTVREMYGQYAGWDPFTDWDQDRFDYDMSVKVEPNLPQGFVFLMDYPPAAASLSRLRGDVAERWELYYDGLELGNCFTELCDGPEQRRRFNAAKAERQTLGESDYPLDEEFLESLPLIGSAAGIAIGIDRLVMLLCGAKDIHDVLVGA